MDDPTISKIIGWLVLIVVVLLCGWFILEIVDRIDDDVNTGMIVFGSLL
jgi:hypothetical protein